MVVVVVVVVVVAILVQVVVAPEPWVRKIHMVLKSVVLFVTVYLQTNKHDDISLSLLWLVRLNARIHKSNKLLENCLLDDNPLVQA